MHETVWSQHLGAWSRYMRAGGIPETTIGLRTYHLSRVAAAMRCPPSEVTTDQLIQWLSDQPWKPSTRRSYRSSLRAFYRWAMDTSRSPASPAHSLPPIRIPRGRPRPLPEDDFRAALAQADDRARLAILLAGVCGLRRSELVRARREDAERDLLGWHLRVVGKGGHVRLVPMPDDVAAAVRACPPGWLFPSQQTGSHLTPHYLGKIISALLPPGMATRTLRHRCGTQALRAAGGNIRVVQEILGHAKPETTAIYTQVDAAEMREAVSAIAPPA